ncbi:hypothetical protein PCANC_15207 [Puccinia coronata f. sp. avenae]|uniref:Uncharacterized protein n=1 Tax=Puccinia coronata f. sp. avenae TaxID=200324 RepID=A0A2N5UFC8_9BASI|nr:hypothetical protein PCANC_15207 [Puccinia coronata f. sp. avenae]
MAASKFILDAGIRFKLGRAPPSESLTDSNSAARAFGHQPSEPGFLEVVIVLRAAFSMACQNLLLPDVPNIHAVSILAEVDPRDVALNRKGFWMSD